MRLPSPAPANPANPVNPLARRVGIVVLAAVQVLVLSVGVLWASARHVAIPLEDEGPYVLLVLGSDEGPPRNGHALTGRADGFHLLVVSPDHAHVSILSFPRDTWVSVPGLGNSKINGALTLGPDAAVATAEAVSGLEVDDWIVTSFNGFMTAVDLIGGVDIDVEQRLHDAASGSNFQAGRQVMTGSQALAYVRDRKSRPGGDLDRSESHARFIQATHAQLVAEAPSPARLAELVGYLVRSTESSIDTKRLFALAALAMQIPPENVARRRLDAQIGTAGAASVVRLTQTARATLQDVANNGLLDELLP